MKSLICSLALLTAVGLSAARADDGDLLRQARRDRDLATQRAEEALRTTVSNARKQTAADALATMKKLLADIEGNSGLDPSRKGDMVKELQSRIKQTEAIANSRRPSSEPTPAEKRRAKKEEEDHQFVTKEIAEIERMMGQGRTQEASRRAQQLVQDYPNNSVARAMGQKTSLQAALRDAKEALATANEGRRREIVKIDPGIPEGDLKVDPKRWNENKVSPHRGNGKPLTEKEQAILKAMNKTLTPDWKGAKFDAVIEGLQTALGTTIVIDPKAKEELNITSDTLVSLSLPREISTRTALRKVLLDAGLGYVIKEEMIYVTTLAKTRDMMTTRAYYIGDIVTADPFRNPLPGQMQDAENQVVKAIVDSIKRSVDPMSWEDGGKASIHYDPVTKSIIVRQSAEVHMLLRNSMK